MLTLDKKDPLNTKVKTRGNFKARILYIDKNLKDEFGTNIIIALVERKDGSEYPRIIYENGQFFHDEEECRLDIVNIDETEYANT